MANNYISTVYCNPAITVCDDNGYKLVRATRDINHGELLIIEHVYCNKPKLCSMVIEHNEYLFNKYHPRRIPWMSVTKNINEMVDEKIQHNAFAINNKCVISDLVTNINHSCTPNCGIYTNVNVIHQTRQSSNDIIFLEIYAIDIIKNGCEITIAYNPITGHNDDRDFICNCQKTLAQRMAHHDELQRITISICNKDGRDKQFAMIRSYLQSRVAKKIISYHSLTNIGIFFNDDQIMAFSSEGEGYINDTINSTSAIFKLKLFTEILSQKIDSHKS
jgi:hypothetical protein